MGMALKPGSFFHTLVKQGLPCAYPLLFIHSCKTLLMLYMLALFGLYMTPNQIGGAEMMLGGIDYSKFTDPVTWTNVESNQTNSWTLKATGISVNGQTSEALSQAQNFVFDSGTSNLVFPGALTQVCKVFILYRFVNYC
jgi:hypothetical protein